eukprot:CAMPEP_0201905222 /NCGR_PEP_ID=MMETSP0902-20130614/56400_1 /ASSEMBLY_ACC=CAM_ASM_000551 /TAXON_ID=420261 /ORGANISM="Thalassiosira antarctica, Strain CCMP982" /LENGTH=31 /DNA_ID= /DNA_START= /DNA_END= /DNA_ORIENTATION=
MELVLVDSLAAACSARRIWAHGVEEDWAEGV